MKVNSRESIASANTVLRRYGSWTEARAAATISPDGALRIPREPHPLPSERERPPPRRG
jgi:hypothetical protein